MPLYEPSDVAVRSPIVIETSAFSALLYLCGGGTKRGGVHGALVVTPAEGGGAHDICIVGVVD